MLYLQLKAGIPHPMFGDWNLKQGKLHSEQSARTPQNEKKKQLYSKTLITALFAQIHLQILAWLGILKTTACDKTQLIL